MAGGAAAWRAAAAAFRARLRRALLLAALAGAVSALAGVVLEAAEAAGVSGWSALKPHTLSEVIGTRFGTVWTIAAGAWLLAGLLSLPLTSSAVGGQTGLGRRFDRPTAMGVAVAVPIAYLLIAPALGGHGATQPPVGVMFGSIVVHVASMSLWLGGLAALLACVPAATRSLEGADRTRLLAATLTRFSALALGAVIALLATGLVQSYVEVRHLSLIFTTPFVVPRSSSSRSCCGLIGLGRAQPAADRAAAGGRRARRHLPGEAGVLLRRTLRAEVALIAVVLGTTGALASYAPAIAQRQGPVNETARIGPAEVQLAVDPAQVGANEVHLYLIDPVNGAQFTRLKQLTVTATLASKGIGPLPLDAQLAGPGHFVIQNAFLTAKGDWDVKITMRVSSSTSSCAT